MSSEPYTPEETILRDICVTSMRMDGIEFDRLIAKIKADALREWKHRHPIANLFPFKGVRK